MADKAIIGSTKVALRYHRQWAKVKRYLEMIDTLVFFSENLTLQNASDAKVQQIEIWRFWWPLCGRNKAGNILSITFLKSVIQFEGLDFFWIYLKPVKSLDFLKFETITIISFTFFCFLLHAKT